jgi:hypothetical protein
VRYLTAGISGGGDTPVTVGMQEVRSDVFVSKKQTGNMTAFDVSLGLDAIYLSNLGPFDEFFKLYVASTMAHAYDGWTPGEHLSMPYG